jgi:phosphomannomutase/phosphoglucomutase
MGRLFGTNGVRGVANKELKAEDFTLLANCLGSVLGEEIALGWDGRTTSSTYKDAAMAGLMSVGCKVHVLGLISTPAFQYSVKKLGFEGGMMITASHNPPEFNGLKAIYSDGVEVPPSIEEEIEEIYFNGGSELAPWSRVGEKEEWNTLDAYVDAVVSHIDLEEIKGGGLRIALDLGNGVAALTAPEVAGRLSDEVYTVNAEVDGRFPGRGSEPRPDNVEQLQELVKATDADFGIAFDGDGDRSLFVDEKGSPVWGDRSLALLLDSYLEDNPGSTVATPVSSSRIIEDTALAHDSHVHWTRVGAPKVSRVMVEKNIGFGGEENGGVMYGPHLPVRDGVMAMALMVDTLVRRGKRLSRLLERLPYYHQVKDRVTCPDNLKEHVLKELAEAVDAPRVETIDGVKLHYGDGAWILIRPSGTEPIFRLYAEAKSEARVRRIVGKHKKMVEEIISLK